MSVQYHNVVPGGRSFQEYVDIFSLSDEDLNKSILGCGDGPASFNCEMNRMGKSVVSVDPIYELDREMIQKRIDETYLEVLEQTRANKDKFIWKNISSVEELGEIRMSSMSQFLDDFEKGKIQGRYIAGGLPELPFADNSFDLALVSHLLFLYSEQLSFDFHVQAIDELLRVASEVRIFPLVDLNSRKSIHLDEIIGLLVSKGYVVSEEKVNYEFQKGGDTMLKIMHV
ncbi:SAM-dependent methyltransferase [Methanolobus vulcani]|uniref:Class I SAM-dependent methyltransferase n=1 Tax=Methanolobus vulcani TaxID=38026 RepID=A0A7Z8KPN0_9EURY|nr:SAM-dependent methyltransferase [Methanolobus vulcani]TQD26731.1 class I SAM-dependent methyltransferase [Methanolobus vulcani]